MVLFVFFGSDVEWMSMYFLLLLFLFAENDFPLGKKKKKKKNNEGV